MPTPRRYGSHAERQAAYRSRVAAARQQELQARGIPPLPPLPTLPGTRRWTAMTGQALLLLQTVQAEMADYYEQRSERWQESDRAASLAERLQLLQEAIAVIEEIGS
jgi:hypothetical protein